MEHTIAAIAKINAEMQKKPADKYLEAVGHHVIDACASAANAAAVLVDGKTLAGAMAEVKKRAQNIARNNVAVIGEDDVYATVDAYFGITGTPAAPVPAPQPKPAGIMLDFDKFF